MLNLDQYVVALRHGGQQETAMAIKGHPGVGGDTAIFGEQHCLQTVQVNRLQQFLAEARASARRLTVAAIVGQAAIMLMRAIGDRLCVVPAPRKRGDPLPCAIEGALSDG